MKLNVKNIAIGSLLAAVSTILLAVGSVIETLDISLAVTASIVVFALILEQKDRLALSVYIVTSLLSLLLLPQKMPALMYLMFFGWYPFGKRVFEKTGRAASWVLKILFFNIAVLLYWLAAKFILLIPDETKIIFILTICLANAAFVLYDIFCTKFVVFYYVRISPRIRKLMK